MTGVIGFTRLLEKTELDNQQRDYTRIIGSSANNLLEIINELLDFSKLESGKIELDERDFDVDDLLADAQTTVTPGPWKRNCTDLHQGRGCRPSCTVIRYACARY